MGIFSNSASTVGVLYSKPCLRSVLCLCALLIDIQKAFGHHDRFDAVTEYLLYILVCF